MNNPIVPTPAATESPTPPPGFKLEYFCSCGMGCTPDSLNVEDGCEIEGSFYQGPSVHLKSNSGCQLSSSWSPEDGIKYHLSKYGFSSDAPDAKWVKQPWTFEELEFLPVMIAKILEQVGSE